MIHCFISGQQEEGERIKVPESTRERAQMPTATDALWQRRLSEQPTRQLRPLTAPLLHTLRNLPLGFRLWRQAREERGGRDPVLDASGGQASSSGLPAGGMGGGCVGRSWRGDFEPGLILPNGRGQAPVVPANQFSVFIEPDGEDSEATVLNPGMPPTDRLGAWDWSFVGEESYYSALFPRAWTVYDEPEPRLRLTSRQISPVIGNNYKESSLPACVFVWTLENLDQEDEITASLMFTWQNGTGAASDALGGHANTPFTRPHPERDDTITGVVMDHKQWRVDERGGKTHASSEPLSFAIAASSPDSDAHITVRSCWTTNSDGAEVWKDFKRSGALEENWDALGKASQEGQTLGAAIAVRVTIPPGEHRQVEFALAWDHPVVEFGAGRRYTRRYTRFYSQHGDSAAQLACDALVQYPQWERLIEQWQAPILDDKRLPGWYKSALFNELYCLVSGGTVWLQDELSAKEEKPRREKRETDGQEEEQSEVGRWACLESQEHRLYNASDALFYASFALIANWPQLQLALQREVAAATLREDSRMVDVLATGRQAPNKVRGAVPYDMGTPADDPWVALNAYNIHETSSWKDLNSKFVLGVYRDFVATQDKRFLADVWPAVDAALRHLQQFDRNKDGMIENEGLPDQTYHSWTATGVSAYSGGLWVAALSAACAMAQALQLADDSVAQHYRDLHQSAARVYNESLWNPSGYFNYDTSTSTHHDSIQADQLCGQWYARACGLPSIAPDKRIVTALKTVFANNVKKFNEGKRGAVNGMRPDGRVDYACLHSSEAWPGTTFALAACMMGEGLVDQAFITAAGVCGSIYEDLGYWFRTPEAWDGSGNYRALGHMRPLAIWAMQWAWTQRNHRLSSASTPTSS